MAGGACATGLIHRISTHLTVLGYTPVGVCICFIPTHPLHAQVIDDPRDCIPILRVAEAIFLGNSSMSRECLGSEWIVSE